MIRITFCADTDRQNMDGVDMLLEEEKNTIMTRMRNLNVTDRLEVITSVWDEIKDAEYSCLLAFIRGSQLPNVGFLTGFTGWTG